MSQPKPTRPLPTPPHVGAYNEITALQLDTIYAQNQVLMTHFTQIRDQFATLDRLSHTKQIQIDALRAQHVNTKAGLESAMLRLEHKIALLRQDVASNF